MGVLSKGCWQCISQLYFLTVFLYCISLQYMLLWVCCQRAAVRRHPTQKMGAHTHKRPHGTIDGVLDVDRWASIQISKGHTCWTSIRFESLSLVNQSEVANKSTNGSNSGSHQL